MSETVGGDLALLACAGHLASIAREAESVDASVPILCGVAAHKLCALLGVTTRELPQASDDPREIAWLLGSIVAGLASLEGDPGVREVLTLVRAARREMDVS